MTDGRLLHMLTEECAVGAEAVAEVLAALQRVVVRELEAGEDVTLPGVGRFTRGASGDVRVELAPGLGPAEPPLWWDEPEHLEARRLASTLVSDLALYRTELVPDLSAAMTDDAVARRCSEALGPWWSEAHRTFVGAVDPSTRSQCDHLIDIARQRWSTDAMG